ncbi:MAG: SAM-dependent chlorinase/fluorinase [Gammaproteobacteria bacterium]|nr:SAM-dependent chlorinase/fluorinase [Gammaproteobacteria bacterium]
MAPVIALLTDFGTQDAYVGVMKGVILDIVRDVRVVDLTHAVGPQDLRAGAYVLWSAYRYFPDGTVFCAVVDPGVGSARRALALRLAADGRRYAFVAPDNGLLTPLLDSASLSAAVALENPRYRLPAPSATFHGRDVFAPAAAHLAAGVPLEALGPALDPQSLVRIDWPQPQRTPEGWHGCVLYVDRFGNLITNLPGTAIADGDWRVRVAQITIERIARTFADVPEGSPVAYIGSSGLLELGLRNGDAHALWGVAVATPVAATQRARDQGSRRD